MSFEDFLGDSFFDDIDYNQSNNEIDSSSKKLNIHKQNLKQITGFIRLHGH